MTIQHDPELDTAQTAAPQWTRTPERDEGLWRSWTEKNEKRDKLKFARRVKVLAILVLLLVLLGLVREIAG